METAIVEQQSDTDPIRPPGRERGDAVSNALVKAQLVVGVALGAVAGPLFAHAIMTEYTTSWWVGGICLATGIVLILAGLTSSKRRSQLLLTRLNTEPSAGASPRSRKARRDATMPMLGALLVYKYGAITERQLQRALEQQRQAGEPRPLLGEVLLDMGLVTDLQLRKALAYQRSREKRVAGAGPANGGD
jgi:hypothetical protein